MSQDLGNCRGVVANVLDCNIVRSEIELQSYYFVHFRINTLGKGMNFHIPNPSYGLNGISTALWHIGHMGRMFAIGPGHRGSIPSRVIPKTLKMVLDTSLLNTQQYKVHIKGKVGQSRERSSAPLHFGIVAIEKGTFWSPSTTVAFTFCTLVLP